MGKVHITAKKLRRIGYILIPVGILGFLIEPCLCAPLNASKLWWFFHSLQGAVAQFLVVLGILGFLCFLGGVLGEIPLVKSILNRLTCSKGSHI